MSRDHIGSILATSAIAIIASLQITLPRISSAEGEPVLKQVVDVAKTVPVSMSAAKPTLQLLDIVLGTINGKALSTEQNRGSEKPPADTRPQEKQPAVLPSKPRRRRETKGPQTDSLPVNPRTGEPLDLWRKRFELPHLPIESRQGTCISSLPKRLTY